MSLPHSSPVLLRPSMDTGHYNCRDYYISPPYAPAIPINDPYPHKEAPRASALRNETWEELEERSRSPASKLPKFPLLDLPLELRQQILRYLLPYTKELSSPTLLSRHIRSFGAVQKRCARGMNLPTLPHEKQGSTCHNGVNRSGREGGVVPSNVVWQKGNVSVMSVCKQLHDECADILYGENTFLLLVDYSGVIFKFRWLHATGLTPNKTLDFFTIIPRNYMVRLKKAIVYVDHVDSYTGMTKFNVGGLGLVHGLHTQVQRLVDALSFTLEANGERGAADALLQPSDNPAKRVLNRLFVFISGGSGGPRTSRSVTDQSDAMNELEKVAEPFTSLRYVRCASVGGSLSEQCARNLEEAMMKVED